MCSGCSVPTDMSSIISINQTIFPMKTKEVFDELVRFFKEDLNEQHPKSQREWEKTFELFNILYPGNETHGYTSKPEMIKVWNSLSTLYHSIIRGSYVPVYDEPAPVESTETSKTLTVTNDNDDNNTNITTEKTISTVSQTSTKQSKQTKK